MKTIRSIAVSILVSTALTGCFEEPTNKSGLAEGSYESSRVTGVPMVFPAGAHSVYKEYGSFHEREPGKKYSHPNKWVVYMAATGWTNEGKPITDRLAFDAAQARLVLTFIRENGLRDQVKVAWLQYDRNPSAQYLDPAGSMPNSFIPLFLQPMGPDVDFYIYSPVERYKATNTSQRYDLWLKPYMNHTKLEGDTYITESSFHRNEGFDDLKGPYWDQWARHWFIVNPEGVVVDAYLSNMGHAKSYGSDVAINSLIHHFDLDYDEIVLDRKLHQINYDSRYSAPFWDKLDSEIRKDFGLD